MLQACLTAAGQLEAGYDIALDQHRCQVEQARYQAAKAERRYRAVDPENRLVARGLETQWEHALQAQSDAEAELTRREKARPATLTGPERAAILALVGTRIAASPTLASKRGHMTAVMKTQARTACGNPNPPRSLNRPGPKPLHGRPR